MYVYTTCMHVYVCIKCVSLLIYRYFLRKLKKVKKSNGQVLAINEVSNIPFELNLCYLPKDELFFWFCPVKLVPCKCNFGDVLNARLKHLDLFFMVHTLYIYI